MLKRLLMILLSGLTLYTQLIFAEQPYQGWQGEWGKWEKDSKGKYKGASISIFACDNNTCKVRLGHNDDYGNGILSIISATEANVHSEIFSGNLHLQRVVTANHPQIIMKAEGEWCKTYPSPYDFRTDHVYLDRDDGVLPTYKLDCYVENDPGIRTWCDSPEVLSYDSKAAELIQGFEKDPLLVWIKMDDWRTDSLKACRYQKDFMSCYKNQFAKFAADIKNATTEQTTRYAALHNPGDINKASQIIDNIAGVYRTTDFYKPPKEKAIRLENILEIVKVTNDSIYFRLSTTNTDGCSMNGLAQYKANGSFLYDDKGDNYLETACFLKIIPSEKNIRLEEADDNASCLKAYCNGREEDLVKSFPADRKRTIRYMARLKNSDQYKKATSNIASATSEKNAPLESAPDSQANLTIYDLPTTHPNPYTVGEEMQKGYPIPIPREFSDGTATLQNVKDWSNAYWVSYNYDTAKQPSLEFIDLDESKNGVLAMLQEAQNSTYFLFKKTARGYQYIDTVSGTGYHRLYYPDTKHLYLYFCSHMSASEGGVTLSQIKNDKLKELAGIWIKDSKVYKTAGEKEKENTQATNLLSKLFDGTLTESELKTIFNL